MELTQLKYFLEVAKNEHVTQSAKNLCVVQPALTQAIHKLEDELGVQLFKTVGRNIRLTDSGKFFYQRLKPLYEKIDALPQQLKAFSNLEDKNICLNVLAASTLITNAVIGYIKSHPSINIDLIQNAETNLFDICVRTYREYNPELDEIASDQTFVYTEKIFLAVPNTPQYRFKKSISLFDLKNEKFIIFCGPQKYQEICNSLCEKIGFKVPKSFESDSTAAVKSAVAAGIGVCFWPARTWGRLDSKKIKLLKISDGNFKRDIVISYRKNKQNNQNTEKFYRYLIDYISAHYCPR
ncbi:MAG: LysR family transcriptional regulator [Fibrobacteraceae bacterium]|nr:LysR family transcriptional regulator [Fibrobacteraceae bacterium]